MIVWCLDLQLPVQSVPITTKVVSSNPAHGEVYWIQHYGIKFVSDLRQVCGFLHAVSKRFFSETTWTIETKLPRNDHWKVLYKVCVFLCRSKIQDGRHRST